MSVQNLSDAEKAAILDWLLTPSPSGREDRPDRIARSVDRVPFRNALFEFRVWGTPEEFIEAVRKEMLK